MKKRFIAILACVCMIAGLLAACGSDANTTTAASDDSATTEGGETTKAASDDSIITGFDWMAENEPDTVYYKDFIEEFGEVTKDMVPENFSIGVVSMASSNNYWINLNEGVQKRCDELGITVQIEYVDGPADFEGTLANAENLYNQGFDAYIFSPENETCLDEITKKIVGEGYPVINAYCCELSGATCFIGSLDSEVAQAAAKMAIEYVGNDGVAAVAMGDVGGKLAQTGTRYYEKYLQDNSNVTVEEIPAQWDPSTARTMTTDLLTANPDVKFIFCNNDDLGLGVYEGLREANATGTCRVVSMDGTTQGLQSVKAGEIYGTFWNNPQYIGELSVDACVLSAIGKTLPRVIRTDYAFVNADNVDEYYQGN